MVSILTLLEQAMDDSYQLIMFVYIIWEVELVQYSSFPRRAWKFKHTNLNVQQKPSHNRQTIIQTQHNTICIWVRLIVGRLFYSMLSSPYVSTLFYCYYYYYQSISSDLMEGYRQNISLSHQIKPNTTRVKVFIIDLLHKHADAFWYFSLNFSLKFWKIARS